MKELLTASRMSSLLDCPRKHFWKYEVCLQREVDADALRFGSAWHMAMEARWKGADFCAALNEACSKSETLDEVTVATLSGLLAGYYARWETDPVKEVQPEIEFNLPLTGSRKFAVAGKIDGLGVMHDGRLALVEHKTTSADVGPDSDYWIRLRANPQVMQYVLAARELAWDIAVVIYDVTRKPSIRVKQNETPEQYADRLRDDCAVRPEFYFARREVPIIEKDLYEFSVHRAQLAKMILALKSAARKAQRPHHAWPRHMTEMHCKGCEFNSFCLQNIVPDPANPPSGFRIGKQNPELAEEKVNT